MRRAPRNLLVLAILVLFGIGVATVIKRRGDETKTATGPGVTTTLTTRPSATTATTPTSVAGQATTTPSTSVAGQATTTTSTSVAGATTSVAGATTSITRSTLATTTTLPGATTTTTAFGATTTTPTIAAHPMTGGGGALGPGIVCLLTGVAGLAVVHRRRPPPAKPVRR